MKKPGNKQLVLIGIRRKGERGFKIQTAGTKNNYYVKPCNKGPMGNTLAK